MVLLGGVDADGSVRTGGSVQADGSVQTGGAVQAIGKVKRQRKYTFTFTVQLN